MTATDSSALPVVSIVTPSFNQGRFLGQTIESVLSQQGDFSIDYIIADGGSTDGSVEIIKKYERSLKEGKYPLKCRGVELRWWSRPDKGQSDAINHGLRLAKGEVLAWINSDDYYEPGAFARVLKAFDRDPRPALIYGDCLVVREDSGEVVPAKPEVGDFERLLRDELSIYQPSVFFTKAIIEKVGLLDENLHYAMDYDLWLRIWAAGEAVSLPEALADFRVWDGSKTSPRQEQALFTGGSADYTGKMNDAAYLLDKYAAEFKAHPAAHAIHLRRLGTMNLLLGNKKESLRYFSKSIRVHPSARNIATFAASLLGRNLYYVLLERKRKIAGDVIGGHG